MSFLNDLDYQLDRTKDKLAAALEGVNMTKTPMYADPSSARKKMTPFKEESSIPPKNDGKSFSTEQSDQAQPGGFEGFNNQGITAANSSAYEGGLESMSPANTFATDKKIDRLASAQLRLEALRRDNLAAMEPTDEHFLKRLFRRRGKEALIAGDTEAAVEAAEAFNAVAETEELGIGIIKQAAAEGLISPEDLDKLSMNYYNSAAMDYSTRFLKRKADNKMEQEDTEEKGVEEDAAKKAKEASLAYSYGISPYLMEKLAAAKEPVDVPAEYARQGHGGIRGLYSIAERLSPKFRAKKNKKYLESDKEKPTNKDTKAAYYNISPYWFDKVAAEQQNSRGFANRWKRKVIKHLPSAIAGGALLAAPLLIRNRVGVDPGTITSEQIARNALRVAGGTMLGTSLAPEISSRVPGTGLYNFLVRNPFAVGSAAGAGYGVYKTKEMSDQQKFFTDYNEESKKAMEDYQRIRSDIQKLEHARAVSMDTGTLTFNELNLREQQNGILDRMRDIVHNHTYFVMPAKKRELESLLQNNEHLGQGLMVNLADQAELRSKFDGNLESLMGQLHSQETKLRDLLAGFRRAVPTSNVPDYGFPSTSATSFFRPAHLAEILPDKNVSDLVTGGLLGAGAGAIALSEYNRPRSWLREMLGGQNTSVPPMKATGKYFVPNYANPLYGAGVGGAAGGLGYALTNALASGSFDPYDALKWTAGGAMVGGAGTGMHNYLTTDYSKLYQPRDTHALLG